MRFLERFIHRSPLKLSVEEAYARWAANYPPHAHNRLMQLEEEAVMNMLPDPRGVTALDLACGSGRYLRHLRERGAARVVGTDLSPAMLTRAQTETARAELAQADLLALPLPTSTFHLVVCGLAVGHVRELQQALAEISRVLLPDGVVVYSDFHPISAANGWTRSFQAADGKTYTIEHHTHFYADHHAACHAAGLVVEDLREPRIDFDHPWRGCPAILAVRARKVTH
jgi:malonyl-CoA O-methyltransferase